METQKISDGAVCKNGPLNFIKKIRGTLIEYTAVFAAALIRFFFFGFDYYPLLDDYIQYRNYPSSLDYNMLIKQEGLLASRPLAGVCDIYVWAKFWGNMAVAVLILAALWAMSAVLFKKVFGRFFGCGYIFLALYTLLPMNFEGTYWMSASTRIVCGMFFTALSLRLLLLLFDCKSEGKVLKICLLSAAFFVCQLVSFGFYEQILVLSFSLALMLSAVNFISEKGHLRKNSFYGLLSFVSAAAYFIFTAANASGNLTTRMQIILPGSGYYFDVFLPELLKQIKTALTGSAITLFEGFPRGAGIIASNGMWIGLVLIFAAGTLWFIAAQIKSRERGDHEDNETVDRTSVSFFKNHRILFGLIFAFLAFLAPITPYFIIANPWFSFRALVPPLCGAALAADIIISFALNKISRLSLHLFSKRKNNTQNNLTVSSELTETSVSSSPFSVRIALSSLISALFCVIFCIASVSELYDYRNVHLHDTAVTNALIEKYTSDSEAVMYDEAGVLASKRVGIFNLSATGPDEQLFFYHEHVCGVTENSWALTGMLAARRLDHIVALDNRKPAIFSSIPAQIPSTVPLSFDFSAAYPEESVFSSSESSIKASYYIPWNASIKRPDGFDILFWIKYGKNGEVTLTRVYAEKSDFADVEVWRIFDSSENEYARIYTVSDQTGESAFAEIFAE